MFSFFKKLPIKKTTSESNFQEITKNLYQQSFELVVKNRTLAHLNQLYEISVRNLIPEELAKHIVTVIQGGLDSEFTSIFLYDATRDTLVASSTAYLDRQTEAVERVAISQKNKKPFVIKKVTQVECLRSLFQYKEPCEIENISSFFQEIQNKLFEAVDHLKLILVYPLLSEDKIIGVLMIGFNRPIMELTEFEKESVKSFANVVAVALDKALVYDALRMTNKKLEEVNRGQESLIHVMNHQIKGYLTVARNVFSELSLNTFGELPLQAKTIVQTGLSSIEEGVQYIQTILHATSARDGTLRYNMEPIDIKTIVQDVAEKQRTLAEKQQLRYKVDIMDGIYVTIGDAIQLAEAFKNLITNAIKYNTKNGAVTITLTLSAKKITFSVKDAGVGIADEDIDRLFIPGGMGRKSLAINSDASGYGLSFVKDVITKHRGSVGFRSNAPEKGTTFFITLPVKTSKKLAIK